MELDEQVLSIQRSYPQVFHACHTQHLRRRTSHHEISDAESSALAHLDARRGTRPGELAAHLSLAPSSLSATIARLVRIGLVTRDRSGLDGRAAELRLTPRGREALQAGSVLDTARLGAVLGKLDPKERAAAVRGLDLLARGATALLAEKGSATRWSRRRR
jgi:DNA-binding MarR family transcriptional regulator